MLEKIWDTIKIFLNTHNKHIWIENHLLYLIILASIILSIILILYLIKVNRDIEKLDEKERKRIKELLKFLSNKKLK